MNIGTTLAGALAQIQDVRLALCPRQVIFQFHLVLCCQCQLLEGVDHELTSTSTLKVESDIRLPDHGGTTSVSATMSKLISMLSMYKTSADHNTSYSQPQPLLQQHLYRLRLLVSPDPALKAKCRRTRRRSLQVLRNRRVARCDWHPMAKNLELKGHFDRKVCLNFTIL